MWGDKGNFPVYRPKKKMIEIGSLKQVVGNNSEILVYSSIRVFTVLFRNYGSGARSTVVEHCPCICNVRHR